MLANFLNKTKPINFVGLLVFFFLNYLVSLFLNLFQETILFENVLKSLLLIALFFSVFFFFNFIIVKNKLTLDNSFAFFIFIVLVASIAEGLTDIKAVFLAIIYLLFLRKIYSLQSLKNTLEKLYDSGFWLGVFCIIQPLFIVFISLIYLGIYLHKKITIQTIFAPIVGFITPLFLYFSYLFWHDKTADFISLFNLKFNFDTSFYFLSEYLVFLGFTLLTTIIALLSKSLDALGVNDIFRKSWALLIVNLVIAFVFIGFLPNKTDAELVFLFFPVSIITANGLELIKKQKIQNYLLLLFLASFVLFQYFL